MSSTLLQIFVLGLAILGGAILLNILATKLGLSTWYTFLQNPKQTHFWSFVWLFLLYPLGLGVIAHIVQQLLQT